MPSRVGGEAKRTPARVDICTIIGPSYAEHRLQLLALEKAAAAARERLIGDKQLWRMRIRGRRIQGRAGAALRLEEVFVRCSRDIVSDLGGTGPPEKIANLPTAMVKGYRW